LVCNFEGRIEDTLEGKAKMMAESNINISEVRFTAAPPRDLAGGLLGFVDCILNGALKLSGLALRRTRKGDLRLSFPAKRDANGQEHYVVRPIHDVARQEIEGRIIAALGHQVEQP
jgi:DNA-binding cell septation regulator SpoVG